VNAGWPPPRARLACAPTEHARVRNGDQCAQALYVRTPGVGAAGSRFVRRWCNRRRRWNRR
jgi:hypothetical protein